MGARLADPTDAEAATLLATVKRAGFGDRELAGLAGTTADDSGRRGSRSGFGPGYAMVDTCAAEFAAETPYFYATYAAAGSAPEAPPVERPAALVIGSGPVRIGQGIEFDYCAVQAADTLRRSGWRAVMINSNPETVSTDFDASSRLYFEPLDPESVRSVIDAETPDGDDLLPAVVAFGGQTPLNLAAPLAAGGVPLLGSDLEAIDQAEERTRFSALLDRLGIPQPEGGMAHSIEEALTLAERIGYPVIVRPSFVIGGLAIDFCYSPEDLERQLAAATVVDPDRPVRIDRYLEGVEVDVDAVSDGERVLIPGLLEHVERAGVHSGDSVGVFPPQTVSPGDQDLIVATMERIVLALGARGLVNAQFIVRDDGVYLIEVNPRASRTVPFLSKVTGVPMVELAVRIALGATLPELGWDGGLLPAAGLRRGQGPGLLDRQAAGRGPVGRARACSRPARSSDCIPMHGWRSRRRSWAPPSSRRGPVTTARWPCSRSPTATRARLGRLATALAAAGYRMAATPGTRAALAAAGYEREPVAKLGEAADAAAGEVAILDLIATGEVRLVVNTPTPRSGAVRDAAGDPAGRDRRGHPLPDGDGDRGRRGRGPRPGDRGAALRGPFARRVGTRAASRSAPDDGLGRLDDDRLPQRPQRQGRERHHDDGQRDLATGQVARVERRVARARRRSRGPPRRRACARRRRRRAGRSTRGPAAATPPTARGRRSRTGPSRAGTGRRSRRGCPGRR